MITVLNRFPESGITEINSITEGRVLEIRFNDLDYDGTADDLANNTVVTSVTDSNGYSWSIQGTPLVKTNILNGHSVVQFDGTECFYRSGTRSTYLSDGNGDAHFVFLRKNYETGITV